MEIQHINNARLYLERLGYPSESIILEPKQDGSHYPDLVVHLNDSTFLILELKYNKVADWELADEIKYDPTVRRIQKIAHDLKADYFIIYDGKKFNWFQTGNDGRPEVAREMHFNRPTDNTVGIQSYFANRVNYVLNRLNKAFTQNESFHILSILIYKVLCNDLGQDAALLYDNEYYFLQNSEFEIEQLEHDKREIYECFILLEPFDFAQHKEALIRFISDSFAKNSKGALEVPKWLADFIVSVSAAHNQDFSIDLFSRRGSITLSLCLQGKGNITTIFDDKKDLHWIAIIQMLFNVKENQFIYSRDILNNIQLYLNNNQSTNIFICPPFNVKIGFPQTHFDGMKDITSLSIVESLRSSIDTAKVIAIIPDSLLNAPQHRAFRERILNLAYLEANIKLPNNAFWPNASISTSVIILNKNQPSIRRGTFMAFLTNEKKANEKSNLKEVISKISSFYKGEQILDSKSGFIERNIIPNNLHVSKYWIDSSESKHHILQEGYLSIPLRDITVSINKGKSLVSDANGNIPFVGPGSVRKMKLLSDGLSYGNNRDMPKNTSILDEGDIVVNTIGNHRGESALVTQEFRGMTINRHIILVKPNRSLVNPEYLVIALNSEFVRSQFLFHSSGIVIPSLTIAIVKDVLIPVPSLDEQLSIIMEHNKLINQIAATENTLADLNSALNKRFNQLGKEINI